MFWEGSAAIGAYGTPLASMLLPYWTDDRIASMEGLYYEAAGTTGFHFLAAATLTTEPSNAVRGLPYRTFADFDLGVRYLQILGVRYYAATSPQAKAAAAANPTLREVATVPDLDRIAPDGWTIYEVVDCGGRRGARVRAGGRRGAPRGAELEVRGPRGAAGGHAGGRRPQPVGVPRGPVVRRPRRARPAAHRRWPRGLAACARCSTRAPNASGASPTSRSRTSSAATSGSSSTCRGRGSPSW